MFDENNRGLIDWKKFIAALRPDWEDKAPDTDAQKIHDEVKRLVMLCTCRQKFRVFQVGEGKYRVIYLFLIVFFYSAITKTITTFFYFSLVKAKNFVLYVSSEVLLWLE